MKTDAQIKKDVEDELDWDPAITSTVGVSVRKSVVTLSGPMRSLSEQLAAERAAMRVGGVRAVVVEMEVQLAADAVRSDTDIAAAAIHVLLWNTAVPRGRVQLEVEDGWVKLSGNVDWGYQRRAAEDAVQHLVGVRGVRNHITLMPHLSALEIQQGIEKALTRHAEREARHMQVLVDGSRVTLAGKVDSMAESLAAQGAVLSAPGVSVVINELVVE